MNVRSVIYAISGAILLWSCDSPSNTAPMPNQLQYSNTDSNYTINKSNNLRSSFYPVPINSLRKFSSEDGVYIVYNNKNYFAFDASQTELNGRNILKTIKNEISGKSYEYVAMECIIGADVSLLYRLSSIPSEYSSYICINPDDIIGDEAVLSLSQAQISTFKKYENIFEAKHGRRQVSIVVFGKDAQEGGPIYVEGWSILGRSVTAGQAVERFGSKFVRAASTFSEFVSLIPKRN